jgi:hypothetical protein
MPEVPLLGGLPATGLRLFGAELAITITNGEVWLSIGLALVLGGVCWVFGTWVARTVGLLQPNAPAGEVLGVGLASGLMVLAAWWAAIWSGGRSSFTPVAIGFAIAIAVGLARRFRRPRSAHAVASKATNGEPTTPRFFRRKPMLLTAVAGGVFVIATALLYGSTLASSPRDGVQPVEFSDEAFYSVLGHDLSTTGTETNLSTSGFSDLQGVPSQTWYHWGELWLASAVISVFGTAPLAARYFIVLPVVLLAAAALTGTLVRRLARTKSRRAYVFGVLTCLFLAPVPIPGPFFSSWAVGMIFGITVYGLGAVAVPLALHGVAVLERRQATWALAGYVGSAVAFILPAHIVIAVLALVGLASVWMIRVGQSLVATRRPPTLPAVWRRSLHASGAIVISTASWAMLTGHGLGSSASVPNVVPFNPSWQFSVAFTYLGTGTLLAIPVAALLFRKELPVVAAICLGTVALLVFGAIAWGARLGDFNMFHVFFGGIAVFAAPVGAVAAWIVFERLQATHHLRLAFAAAILCGIQLASGVASATVRLQEFGPRLHNEPVSVNLLEAIGRLPLDAKLAYACRPFEEISFADTSLLSIDAHTGRRVVPMCFEADVFSTLNGAPPSAITPAAGFKFAPQSVLYPNSAADPSPAAVSAFLKGHGIHYIFADPRHPNLLVPDAVLVATDGNGAVLQVP